jgi:hypothetical protein
MVNSASHVLNKIVTALVMVLLLVGVCSCASTPSTTSTSGQAHILLPAPADSSKKALWGFIDLQGKWVIQPQFQAAYRFREELAPVELGGKWGYVSESGTLVITPQYTEAHYFNNGLARVATGPPPNPGDHVLVTASGYGFIDKTGKMVVPADWDDAGEFSEGLAPVMKGSKCGFIDTAGQVVVPLTFDMAAAFSEDLAPVLANGSWGYIDKNGRWVIEPKFYDSRMVDGVGVPDSTFFLGAGRFEDGVAAVAQFVEIPLPDGGTTSGPEFYYIDKKGKQAFEGTFVNAGEFSEGLAPVGRDDPTGAAGWSFIDSSGKAVITGDFKPSVEGLAVDGAGFHEGLAAAETEAGVGYINKDGRFAIQPQFAAGGAFSDGFAYVYTERFTPSPFGGGVPSTLILYATRGLEIIDLTGRVIYKAPAASGSPSTGSS